VSFWTYLYRILCSHNRISLTHRVVVVAGGTFLVIYSGSSKKESIDATEALRPRVGCDIVGDDGDGRKGSAQNMVLLGKSPLLPRHSPALLHGPGMQKKSWDISNGNGTVSTATKVIWEV
jgi:hypothetical protein